MKDGCSIRNRRSGDSDSSNGDTRRRRRERGNKRLGDDSNYGDVENVDDVRETLFVCVLLLWRNQRRRRIKVILRVKNRDERDWKRGYNYSSDVHMDRDRDRDRDDRSTRNRAMEIPIVLMVTPGGGGKEGIKDEATTAKMTRYVICHASRYTT